MKQYFGFGKHLFAAGMMMVALGTSSAIAFDDAQKTEIEGIIREYLLKNPEIMLEVQQALEDRRAAETAALQKKTLNDMKQVIYNSEHQIEIGDPNAPITVVEFYDYNCGFCQRALSDMNRFLEQDKNVRFVLKEFPVLGEASLATHRVSLAFSKLMPEKAAEFHTKLLQQKGRKNGEIAASLAVEFGIDPVTLKAETEKPYIMEAIQEVYRMADGLGITGTPSYVIGDQVVFGAVGYAQLKEKIAEMKTN